MSRQTLLTIYCVGLLLGTITIEALTYVEWEYFRYGALELAMGQFHRFPWFKFSVSLTTLTALAAIAAIRVSQAPRGQLAFTYAIAFVPLAVLVLYPGLKSLGLHSDPSFAGVSLLMILHGFGFSAIARLFAPVPQSENT